jgi:SecD/SecF fusion protein
MQMKGMVRVFAALMIIFSLYQLSFSWFVKATRGRMQEKAERQVKAVMPAANVKYPNDKEMQSFYQDSMNEQ